MPSIYGCFLKRPIGINGKSKQNSKQYQHQQLGGELARATADQHFSKPSGWDVDGYIVTPTPGSPFDPWCAAREMYGHWSRSALWATGPSSGHQPSSISSEPRPYEGYPASGQLKFKASFAPRPQPSLVMSESERSGRVNGLREVLQRLMWICRNGNAFDSFL